MPDRPNYIVITWFCLFLTGLSPAMAQPAVEEQEIQQGSFSQPTWEDLRQRIKINEPKPEVKDAEEANDKRKSSWEVDPGVKLFIKWALFVLLIGFLLMLVLYTLGINPFRKKKNGQSIPIDLETIAEHLDEADLDPYLMEAIKSGNYKLAIRLYYLQIIQRLNFSGKIRWKRHKTNKHYLNEMRAQPDFQTFKSITLTYEKSWFGPDNLNQVQYEQISPVFINYAKNLPVIE
jgi:hypothetical protein